MLKITIEYCVECMFLGRAIEIAKAILEEHEKQVKALVLRPGKDGVLNVTINNKLIYSIGEDGRLPTVETIMQKIKGFI